MLALVGVAICLIYAAGLFALSHHLGVKYTDILESEDNIKRGLLAPVGFMASILLLVTVLGGWLPNVFHPSQTAHYGWMWIVPIIVAVSSVARFWFARWSAFSVRSIVYLIVSVLLVGFSEELLTRGVLVYFVQRTGASSLIIMLVSSVVFGLLHSINYFNGQDGKTTRLQVLLTSIMGLVFYIALIVSGTLWLPIALHALFDLSLMAQGGKLNKSERKQQPWEALMILALYLATFAAVVGVAILSFGGRA